MSVDDPEGKGWFYVGDEGLIGRSEVSSDSVWDCLREEYQGARSAPLSKEFWGDRFLSEADSALYGAIERRRFRHAVDGQPVAAVILTSLF